MSDIYGGGGTSVEGSVSSSLFILKSSFPNEDCERSLQERDPSTSEDTVTPDETLLLTDPTATTQPGGRGIKVYRCKRPFDF